jgi:hypothetical protein
LTRKKKGVLDGIVGAKTRELTLDVFATLLEGVDLRQ